jgi:hypothetical protein
MLTQRMFGNQLFELRNQVGVVSEGKVGVDAGLVRGEPRLRQSCDVTLRELLVGDVGEGVAPPELQRFIEALTRAGLLAVPQCVVTARREGVEAEDIDGRPVDREHISIAAPRDQGRRAERPSQRGYLALECVHAPVGSRVAPEHFDEMIVGHDLSAAQRQRGEEDSRSGSREGQRIAVVVEDLDRSKEIDLHGVTVGRTLTDIE